MANEGEFPKQNGDTLYASEVNLFKRNSLQIYTGTDLDVNVVNTTTENSYEFAAISSSDLKGADYICVKIIGTIQVLGPQTTISRVRFKVQTKEIGGSYSDSLPYTVCAGGEHGASNTYEYSYCFEYLHSLTAGEKANGVQVKIFCEGYSNNTGARAKFNNIQTIIYPV